jgi:hypothetical protein
MLAVELALLVEVQALQQKSLRGDFWLYWHVCHLPPMVHATHGHLS